ncbi:MAG TPA: response regulator [bacterium]|nr:response regulator [bacterium]
MQDSATLRRRVLVIDDNEAIHEDFRKILVPATAVTEELLEFESELFGADASPPPLARRFDLVTAQQGEEGYRRVAEAVAADDPFALAFVDMRMPPGWDGLETIERIWSDFPDIEMVICTAFSDYSWEETIARLGNTDRLLIVKKPFDHVEILQVASALSHKWHLQRQSQDLLDTLADRVKARTEELERARDELVAARDAAEAANRAKTVFLAKMSHELRTPMTAILGFAQELEERLAQLDDDADVALAFEREAAATIRRNADHLIGLIGDLRDVAKFEQGRLVVHKVACVPLELLADVTAMVVGKAQERGLAYDVRCVTSLPGMISTDPLRLRQILLNLIDNAIKFTDEGRVEVRVSYAAEPEPLLRFEVVDTGIGMAPEVVERVFQPFEQADESTNRRFGGSGLGLAISRQLARMLGGDITVRSEPGKGSTFEVTIVAEAPAEGAAQGDAGRDASAPRAAGRQSATSPKLSARVLLVEDGPDNQRLIAHLLRKAGCTVDIAENGAVCLDRMADPEQAFDIVLMDMQMPVMGGIEATRMLRERGVTTPIIALTANAMASDEEACRAAGCDGFLTKPIDRRRLLEAIAEKCAP